MHQSSELVYAITMLFEILREKLLSETRTERKMSLIFKSLDLVLLEVLNMELAFSVPLSPFFLLPNVDHKNFRLFLGLRLEIRDTLSEWSL